MTEEYVLLNGTIVNGRQARISVFDRGLLHGDGFFETMRVERRHVLFLDAHLERLRKACASFNIELAPVATDDWAERIGLLVEKNRLEETVAVAKILVTRGTGVRGLGFPRQSTPTVVAYASRYEPPAAEKYRDGIAVEVFPYPRHSFIADYKSLNYLFYLAAKEWALGRGADEGLVLNVDLTVSEGATTNIFYVKDGLVMRPESKHYLRGVMESQVAAFLEQEGRRPVSIPTTVAMLAAAEEVFLTNSLLGIMPVARIEANTLPSPKPLATFLRTTWWNEGRKL